MKKKNNNEVERWEIPKAEPLYKDVVHKFQKFPHAEECVILQNNDKTNG